MGIRQRGEYQFATSRVPGGELNVSAFHEGNLVGTLTAESQLHRATPHYENGDQGELLRTHPGHLDLLAVAPEYQGEGIGRGLMNVALNRVGTARPSDELTPDSAGLLGHMGVPHAEGKRRVMQDKGRRDQWGEQLLEDRQAKLEGNWPGIVADSGEGDTLRDDTPAAYSPPSFLAGVQAPASRPPRTEPQKERLF